MEIVFVCFSYEKSTSYEIFAPDLLLIIFSKIIRYWEGDLILTVQHTYPLMLESSEKWHLFYQLQASLLKQFLYILIVFLINNFYSVDFHFDVFLLLFAGQKVP